MYDICLTMHLRTSWKVSFQVLSANFKCRSEIMDFAFISEGEKEDIKMKIKLQYPHPYILWANLF